MIPTNTCPFNSYILYRDPYVNKIQIKLFHAESWCFQGYVFNFQWNWSSYSLSRRFKSEIWRSPLIFILNRRNVSKEKLMTKFGKQGVWYKKWSFSSFLLLPEVSFLTAKLQKCVSWYAALQTSCHGLFSTENY